MYDYIRKILDTKEWHQVFKDSFILYSILIFCKVGNFLYISILSSQNKKRIVNSTIYDSGVHLTVSPICVPVYVYNFMYFDRIFHGINIFDVASSYYKWQQYLSLLSLTTFCFLQSLKIYHSIFSTVKVPSVILSGAIQIRSSRFIGS